MYQEAKSRGFLVDKQKRPDKRIAVKNAGKRLNAMRDLIRNRAAAIPIETQIEQLKKMYPAPTDKDEYNRLIESFLEETELKPFERHIDALREYYEKYDSENHRLLIDTLREGSTDHVYANEQAK